MSPSFYGYDGFGTVRQLTNSAGTITDTYDYDAFGNKINSTGTTPNNYLYRGEQWDSDLGLYYLRARYYNSLTGRFMSRDPEDPRLFDEDGVPTDPKRLHKYLYAGGDPVDAMDPTGREESFESFVTATIAINARVIFAAVKLGCQLQTAYNFLYTTVAFVVNNGHVSSFGDPGIPILPKYVCAGVTLGGLF